MIKKIIAIYPGRFQPFGPHHAKTFKWLQKQFGTSNTFIVTSDKVSLPKSPLDFDEKRVMMIKSGIPASQIYKVKNPYKPIELTDKFDSDTTAVVVIYGEKDAGRIKYNKVDGSKGYFQPYVNKDKLEGLDRHGYIVVAPNVSIQIPGYGAMSGTKLRQFIPQASPQNFKKLYGWYDEKLHTFLADKFSSFNESTESTHHGGALDEVSAIGGNQSVDDGPRFMYGDLKSYQSSMNDTAKRPEGWEVTDWIIGDMTSLEKHVTDWPNGPVPTVSFYPTGVPGDDNAGTSYYKDLKGNPAFKAWMNFAKKIAVRDGNILIDDLGAEFSIADSNAVVNESKNWRSSISIKDLADSIQASPAPLQDRMLLTCGGGAGHMSHIIEDDEMTFGDLKDIIKRSLEGDLDIEGAVTEKCISGDSLIDVEGIGKTPISKVVDDHVGEKVLAYNQKTGEDEYLPILNRFNNDVSGGWYELLLEDGKSLTVTGNHKIYTENRGYVRVDELTTDDVLKIKKDENK